MLFYVKYFGDGYKVQVNEAEIKNEIKKLLTDKEGLEPEVVISKGFWGFRGMWSYARDKKSPRKPAKLTLWLCSASR